MQIISCIPIENPLGGLKTTCHFFPWLTVNMQSWDGRSNIIYHSYTNRGSHRAELKCVWSGFWSEGHGVRSDVSTLCMLAHNVDPSHFFLVWWEYLSLLLFLFVSEKVRFSFVPWSLCCCSVELRSICLDYWRFSVASDLLTPQRPPALIFQSNHLLLHFGLVPELLLVVMTYNASTSKRTFWLFLGGN